MATSVQRLAGSVAMGLLYDHSRIAVVAVVVIAQLASLPLFVLAGRRLRTA